MKQATMLTFPALLASGTMQAANLNGSVQKASGDGIAATIVVRSDYQGAGNRARMATGRNTRSTRPIAMTTGLSGSFARTTGGLPRRIERSKTTITGRSRERNGAARPCMEAAGRIVRSPVRRTWTEPT